MIMSMYPAASIQTTVEHRLIPDAVIRQRALVLQPLALQEQPHTVVPARRNALLVLNLRLDPLDGVGVFGVERDRLA